MVKNGQNGGVGVGAQPNCYLRLRPCSEGVALLTMSQEVQSLTVCTANPLFVEIMLSWMLNNNWPTLSEVPCVAVCEFCYKHASPPYNDRATQSYESEVSNLLSKAEQTHTHTHTGSVRLLTEIKFTITWKILNKKNTLNVRNTLLMCFEICIKCSAKTYVLLALKGNIHNLPASWRNSESLAYWWKQRTNICNNYF